MMSVCGVKHLALRRYLSSLAAETRVNLGCPEPTDAHEDLVGVGGPGCRLTGQDTASVRRVNARPEVDMAQWRRIVWDGLGGVHWLTRRLSTPGLTNQLIPGHVVNSFKYEPYRQVVCLHFMKTSGCYFA